MSVFNPDRFFTRRTIFSRENFGPPDQYFQDQNSRDRPSEKRQGLSLKSPKIKEDAACRVQASKLLTVLQFLLTSNLVKKRQRVIVVAIANAIAEQQVIVVAIASPIAHSKGRTQNPISNGTQKARGDDLFSRILPEFHFQKAQRMHNLYTSAQELHKNLEIL